MHPISDRYLEILIEALSPYVSQIKSHRQLEVQLYSGTLVRAVQGISDDDVNL